MLNYNLNETEKRAAVASGLNYRGSQPCSSLHQFKHFSAKRQAPSAKRQAPSAKLILHSTIIGKGRGAILRLGLLWVGLMITSGCDGQGAASPAVLRPDSADQSTFPLVVSESPLNLGEVRAGGRKEYEFRLRNRTDSPVEVAQIETSCECLTIDLPNRVVSPAQKVAGRALLDLRQEPRFTGRLGIDVKGRGKSGKVVFALVVKVSVGSE